jgi:hypothetical protein
VSSIHYFPRYSQKENFATNNTLLLLHRLYDYDRYRFERFLLDVLQLIGSEEPQNLELGLQIIQQTGTANSVLDGSLYQRSLRIAVETKLHSTDFSPDQIRRHLSNFNRGENGWLILLSPDQPQISSSPFNVVRKYRKKTGRHSSQSYVRRHN